MERRRADVEEAARGPVLVCPGDDQAGALDSSNGRFQDPGRRSAPGDGHVGRPTLGDVGAGRQWEPRS